MDVITIASLFPNMEQPRHGIFVEERLWHLRQACDARFHVLAPVPWFPFGDRHFGQYGQYARVPPEEERRGLLVRHPRFVTIPKVGMSVQPFLYAAAIAPLVRSLVRGLAGPVVLDGHFLYPDGVATALVARWLGIPYLLTARGSDVNLYTDFRLPRRLITAACRGAFRVITVSGALRERVIGLGIPPEKVATLRNGVDLDRFRPLDRAEARRRTGFSGQTVVAVGNLLPVKDHELLIRAASRLPQVNLVIIGGGPLRGRLHQLARDCGIANRFRLIDVMPQHELVTYYSAADVSVLTSRHEGMPNVVLESLACGTPVVAMACDGVPELFGSPAAGRLVTDRSPGAVAAAISAVLAAPPDRQATRRYATTLGWEPTSLGLAALLAAAAAPAAVVARYRAFG